MTTSFYVGDTVNGAVELGDLPFDLSTPDSLTHRDYYLLAAGSGEAAQDPMIKGSTTYDSWVALEAATGNTFTTRITSLRWLDPCG